MIKVACMKNLLQPQAFTHRHCVMWQVISAPVRHGCAKPHLNYEDILDSPHCPCLTTMELSLFLSNLSALSSLTVSAAPWWRWRAWCPAVVPLQPWWMDRAVPAPRGRRRWLIPAAGTCVHSTSTLVQTWLSISGEFMWMGREEGSVGLKLLNTVEQVTAIDTMQHV